MSLKLLQALQCHQSSRVFVNTLHSKCKPRTYSVYSAVTPLSSESFFKTSETNPINLSSKHLGRFYSIDNDLYEKLYAQHHGFPLEFREQCKVFREQCVLVRKPYLDLKNCVDNLDLRKPTVRFIIHGIFGAGKTMTLASMVHYGFLKEFVLVHIPWVPLWTRWCKELVASTTREGFYDHTINAVSWLTHFKTQNSELIRKLNLVTAKEYQWSKRESTPASSSLLDIVEHGIARPVHASEVILALFQELKQQSSEAKCKTMVIVDGVNDLFHECRWLKKADKRTIVPPSNITAFKAMKELLQPDWTGGVVIVTVDKKAIDTPFRESDLPRYLLLKEGWELFNPFVPIEVPNYTSQEILTTIDYYLERKWLAHPSAGLEEGRLELEYLSTRNPLELMHLCNSR